MKRAQMFTVLFFVLLTLRASEANTGRLQLELSHLQVDYSEKQNSVALSDGKFSQRMAQLRGRGEWIAFADWLVLGAEVEYATPYSSSKESEYSFLKAKSSAAFVFNSRPFYLSVVAEQFYQGMNANRASFGYDSLNGHHVFPQLDFSFERGSRFYLKAPLYSSVDKRKLLTTGLELRLEGETGPYPERHFQKSLILKIEYQSEELEFDENPKKEIRSQSLSIGLGYNF